MELKKGCVYGNSTGELGLEQVSHGRSGVGA